MSACAGLPSSRPPSDRHSSYPSVSLPSVRPLRSPKNFWGYYSANIVPLEALSPACCIAFARLRDGRATLAAAARFPYLTARAQRFRSRLPRLEYASRSMAARRGTCLALLPRQSLVKEESAWKTETTR